MKGRMGRSSKRNITEGVNREGTEVGEGEAETEAAPFRREGSKWRMLDTEGTWRVVAVAVPVVVAVVVVVVAAAAAAAG